MYDVLLFVNKEGNLRRFAGFFLYMHKEAQEGYSRWWTLWCAPRSPPAALQKMKDSLPKLLRGLLAVGLQLTTPLETDGLFWGEPPLQRPCMPLSWGVLTEGMINTGQLPSWATLNGHPHFRNSLPSCHMVVYPLLLLSIPFHRKRTLSMNFLAKSLPGEPKV